MECGRVIFSGHAVKRMFERSIQPTDVVNLLQSGEIIIRYPEDKPFPSFLILGFIRGQPIHVLAALDGETGTCYIVTAYEPDPELWKKRLQSEEDIMRCTLCKLGETSPGLVTVTLDRGSTTVIIKEVPGQVCENCGEYFLDEAVAERVFSMAEDAVRRNSEVEIIRFAA